MTIGERFRELRLHLKLTQDQIGEMCGDATKGLISQWENDLLIPPSDQLIALSDKTAFSIDWLLNGRGEMFEPHLSDAAKHIVNKLSTMTEKEQYRIARMVDAFTDDPANDPDCHDGEHQCGQ